MIHAHFVSLYTLWHSRRVHMSIDILGNEEIWCKLERACIKLRFGGCGLKF